MKIQVDILFVEISDDLKEKGLEKGVSFTVFQLYGGQSSTPPTEIGSFSLHPMPGCCGIVVSTASWLKENYRGTKFGKDFHELKAKVSKELGYSVMIMTTQLRNIPEVVGASKARWKFLHFFRNSRTTNDIGIAVKDL